MSRLLIVLLFAITACQGSRAAERGASTVYLPAQNGAVQPPNNRTLTTTGKATLSIVPDVADVRVSLEVENMRTSVLAANNINRMKARLLAELKRLNIKSSQAIVSTITMRPIYSPYVEGKLRRIVGYNAQSHIRIELRDFDRIAPVLDAAVAAGATRITTGFRSTKMTELKRRVYDMALKAARSKAEQMASALDIQSMRVRTVNEGQIGGGWYGWQSQVSNISNAYEAAPARLGSATDNVTPDSKELTLTMTVVYELL